MSVYATEKQTKVNPKELSEKAKTIDTTAIKFPRKISLDDSSITLADKSITVELPEVQYPGKQGYFINSKGEDFSITESTENFT